jgi:hypothetical protein
MSFYGLQLEQRTKTFWQLPKQWRDYCYNHYNFIKNIRSDNLKYKHFFNSNGRSFVRSIGEVISSSSTEYNNAGWVVSSVDFYGLKTEYTYTPLTLKYVLTCFLIIFILCVLFLFFCNFMILNYRLVKSRISRISIARLPISVKRIVFW